MGRGAASSQDQTLEACPGVIYEACCTRVCTCVHVGARGCARVCVRRRMWMGVRVCVWMGVRVCVWMGVRVYGWVCVRVYGRGFVLVAIAIC